MKGDLDQDVIVTSLGTQLDVHKAPGKVVGMNSLRKLKAGPLNFSDNVEMYVDDLKIITSRSDTLRYPVLDGHGEDTKCLPLRDVPIKLTLE